MAHRINNSQSYNSHYICRQPDSVQLPIQLILIVLGSVMT